MYWLELLIDSGMVAEDKLTNLLQEANEFLAIIVASVNTSREKEQGAPQPHRPK